MLTLTRQSLLLVCAIVGVAAVDACENGAARAPNPTRYAWPDSFAYRLEYAAETQRGQEVVSRFDKAKVLHLAIRNDRYLVWNDDLSSVIERPGGPARTQPVYPEDTLRHFVKLGRRGQFESVVPECDPTVGACRSALPSAVPLELRHIIPQLALWWPPRNHDWTDTLRFDDLPRPGGARGSVVIVYRVPGDTALGGRRYWIVDWHSVERAWRPEGGRMVPDPVLEERGNVLVDKGRLLPAYAQWYGVVPATPALRAAGVTGTGFRARAWLVGTQFDSLEAER